MTADIDRLRRSLESSGWLDAEDVAHVLDHVRAIFDPHEDRADRIQRNERAAEAYAAGGMDAYNDAMGHVIGGALVGALEAQEHGHHCPYSCECYAD